MIEKIEARPFLLENSIQHYAWGAKGKAAFIPQLLDIEPDNDTTYAELWIGAHPKAPSKVLINGDSFPLDKLIDQFPEEVLGSKAAQKFSNKLPFLLKVLSINQALSIQVHPSKTEAKELHAHDPKNYPDENHKPEIAVAIDSLKAVVGFKPVERIKKTLSNYPELLEFIGEEYVNTIFADEELNNREKIKGLYKRIMQSSEDVLTKCIDKLKVKFESKEDRTEEEEEFLKQYSFYGTDAGLISLLLFNMVNLHEGEAFFTGQGIPHAYLKGNIIECMANSDNVVRAGLTQKFKDVDTLLNILTYEDSFPEIIKGSRSNLNKYKTPAEEFELTSYRLRKSEEAEIKGNQSVMMGIILNGEAEIQYGSTGEKFSIIKGSSFLIPALLNNFTLKCISGCDVYIASVPFP